MSAIDRSIAEENVKLKVVESLLKVSNQSLTNLINSPQPVKKNSLVHAQMVLGTAIRNMDEIKLKLAKLDQEKKRSQGKIIVHLVVVHLFLK